MNYEAHYNTLIERANTRLLEGYTEQHHVVPRCLGGRDDADNLVRLTAEEHYVAHQLLVKMNPGHKGLAFAAYMMGTTRQNNKTYGWLRKQASAAQTGTKLSRETRAKMSASGRGKILTEEHKARIGAAHKGMKRPEGTGDKISAAITGFKHTEETRAKMSASHSGKPKIWLQGRPAKNMKQIMINGTTYKSRTHAAKELNKDRTTIYNWLRNGKAMEVV